MTTTVSVSLSETAASAVETVADCIERQLLLLNALARQAGPAAHDDADFVQWHTNLRHSLQALREGSSS